MCHLSFLMSRISSIVCAWSAINLVLQFSFRSFLSICSCSDDDFEPPMMKRPTLAQNLHPIMGRRSVSSLYFTILVLQYLNPISQGVPDFHQDATVQDDA